jgi:hypothetical protein
MPKKIGFSFLLKPLLVADVNRIGFSSLRSEDHPYSCEVLTQGCRFRFAESGFFHCSLSRASSARFTIKKADLLRRVVILVTQTGHFSNLFLGDLRLVAELSA